MTAQTTDGGLERRSIAQILETARLLKGYSKEATVRELDTTRPSYLNWLRGGVPGHQWIDPFVKFTGESKWVIMAAIGIITWEEAEALDTRFGNSANPGSRKKPKRTQTKNRLAA